MSASVDLELMRASMLLDSDPAAAARQAGAILAEFPGHETANLLLATACRRLGDSAGGLAAMEALARANPTSPLIQLELGRHLGFAGRRDEAIAALERAVALDAGLAEGWKELAAQFFLRGATLPGDVAYLNYSRLCAEPPELKDASVALESGRLDAAEVMAREHVGTLPDATPALRLLATIATRRGDDLAVEDHLQHTLRLAPGDAAAREDLARLWIRQGRIDAALPLVERLMAAAPYDDRLPMLKAHALLVAERHDEGLALAHALVAAQPDNADYWVIAGNQERFIGNAARAIDAYRRAIALRPGYGEAYWALSNLKTFRFTEAEIQDMQRQLAAGPSAGPDQTYLQFALGKALEDAQEFAAAFDHYARGNARARAGFAYDSRAVTAFVERFKATFTHDFFADRAAWGNASEEPIFIVGLPRSGSTLLEQILASHSAVEGTRELSDIPAIARELMPYPQSVAALGHPDIESLARRYLEGTRAHRQNGSPRFVDKMLGNFVSLGLIHLMFPRASIIDCRRHPMASGFSCYKQLFNSGMNFAYEQSELAQYIRDYAELMRHVDAVLPGRVYRVHYEHLVADPDSEVRRLLAHCRLPFESDCLRHHENRRVAQTISSEQVRRPIYAEAVDQWRHFQPWLTALELGLGQLAAGYPAA